MSSLEFISWLWQTSLNVSLLILFVLLIRKPVARRIGPHAAYALWLLPCLRLFLPAIPILPLEQEINPLTDQVESIATAQYFSEKQQGPTIVWQNNIAASGEVASSQTLPISPQSGLLLPQQSNHAAGNLRDNKSVILQPEARSTFIHRQPAFAVLPPQTNAKEGAQSTFYAWWATLQKTLQNPTFSAIILFLWATLGLFWLTGQLMRQQVFQNRVMRRTRLCTTPLQRRADHIASSIGLTQPFEVRQFRHAEDDQGAFVTGLLNPIIVLPCTFEDDYSYAEQDMTLLHELCHIKRRDLWASFGVLILRTIQWPNPFAHVAFEAFKADQEASCDMSALAAVGELEKGPLVEPVGKSTQDSSASMTYRTPARLHPSYEYANALVKSAKAARSRVTSRPFSFFTLARKNQQPSAESLSLVHLHTTHRVKERLVLIQSKPNHWNSKKATIASILLIGTGLIATANYTYAAQENETTTDEVLDQAEKRVKTLVIEKEDEDGDANVFVFDELEIDEDNVLTWSDFASNFETLSETQFPNGFFFKFDDDASERIKGITNRRIILNGGDKTIMSISGDDGDFVIERKNGSLTINGKPVPIEDCQSGNQETGTVALKMKIDKNKNDETFEVVCDKSVSWLRTGKGFETSTEDKERALERAIKSMEENIARTEERRLRMIERQLKQVERQKRSIDRLQQQLDELRAREKAN